MNQVRVFVVPTDLPEHVRLGDFKLLIDPSALDDLDLNALNQFKGNVHFNKDGSGRAPNYAAGIISGLNELAYRLGHELVYVDDPTEDEVKSAKGATYSRSTFDWVDMRMGVPSYASKRPTS